MDQFDPRELERLGKYQEITRLEALIVDYAEVTHVEELDMGLTGAGAATQIARSTDQPIICVVVTQRRLLDAMRTVELDLSSPGDAVAALARTLAQRGGRATFAFSSARLAQALDILGPDGRPVLKVGRPRRRTDPYLVVTVRRLWFVRRLRASRDEMP